MDYFLFYVVPILLLGIIGGYFVKKYQLKTVKKVSLVIFVPLWLVIVYLLTQYSSPKYIVLYLSVSLVWFVLKYKKLLK